MRLDIEIRSDDAALTDPEWADLELHDVLKKVTAQIYETAAPNTVRNGGQIYDSNGNRVGIWALTYGKTEG